ncbi:MULTISPECIES: MFS transporter [Methylorubrum]|uniref:Sialic acid transporter NanT n=1 Tax=Methylorubrum aminovorans TaxID=269069 RepID=A0ABQ4U6Q0_9HYPH|nr:MULTISPECIES: MFS transporter [Methylorubrum]AWI89356.1 MFS transporter [Methylobacterium sp. DM1]UGB23865.1 MFS transporter [Methylorubrum sp. B1-46]GJE63115.1 Sialic acid transporter NanT [Methylorubrum aminovorans]HEV2544272.1 MFS transporter [Methylobacterium sp.]
MAGATAVARSADAVRPMTAGEKKVIMASSLGTVFEWYDFYLYGSLAAIIGAQFFSAYPEATRNIFALLAFAAGFLVRPFGALVFGRLGDMVGRKYTFLVTILIMGISTFAVGLLPSYSTLAAYNVGWIAPVTLLALRMLQGLALGGEYGGAAVYVAEHAPMGRRGFYTAFIQTTATLGLLLSLIIILSTQGYVNSAYPATTVTNADGTTTTLTAFQVWGWRIPFLVSVVLLGISVWIRLQMQESPAFKKMKEEGTHSKAPLSEAFGQWKNAKWALLALLGLTAGQAVVWYTGQFYALFFLQSILKVDQFTANIMIAWSLILATGGFLFFGGLSDRIGRKPIILGGCLIAALTYFPLFNMLTAQANPALHAAQANVPVVVKTNKDDCSFQFNPVGTAKFTKECDVAKALLARSAVNYTTENQPAGTPTVVSINGKDFPVADPNFAKAVPAALTEAGYPSAASNPTVIKASNPIDIFTGQKLAVVGILTILVLYVTMVYGPIAAALVELFPTRIRYTSMSLPYHIGNGWFGGLLPATAFAMVAQTGDIYFGLWYPIVIALFTFVIGLIFIPETKDRDILA